MIPFAQFMMNSFTLIAALKTHNQEKKKNIWKNRGKGENKNKHGYLPGLPDADLVLKKVRQSKMWKDFRMFNVW